MVLPPCRDVRAVRGGVLQNLLLHVDEGLVGDTGLPWPADPNPNNTVLLHVPPVKTRLTWQPERCRNGWPRGRLLCEAVDIARGRRREGKDAESRTARARTRTKRVTDTANQVLDSRIIEEILAIGDVAPEEDER